MTIGILHREEFHLPMRVWMANCWFTRLRGLLLREPLAADGSEGMLIVPCNGVHTCGMRYPLDVVFLDQEQRVLAWRENVKPWRFVYYRGAHAVVELHGGVLMQCPPVVGARWYWVQSVEHNV